MEKFYITTPIYYPSGNWHLGHCYSTILSDSIARFKKFEGKKVFFTTGTDEHGQKILDIANQQNIKVKYFIDEKVNLIIQLFNKLDIKYNKFVRTTNEQHIKSVQKIFERLYKQGDIYKGNYEGYYCKHCESYWTKFQLVDGNCPDCLRKVILSKEDCYFFKISKYKDDILNLLNNENFLIPKFRVNEMVNFINEGLLDLAVSRKNLSWGITVPFDKGHTIYVWFDALCNYITSLGFNGECWDDKVLKKYWPCDLHVMSKEIVRFHSIIWPTILIALGLKLPKKILAHGWLLSGKEKMSKSKNNAFDPNILIDKYGSDAVRFFLLKEIIFGMDYSYNLELFLNSYNQNLANDYGNLINRTYTMCKKYLNCIIKRPLKKDVYFNKIIKEQINKFYLYMDNYDTAKAIDSIMQLVRLSNKYIDDKQPWKQPINNVNDILYNLLENIRISTLFLNFFIPKGTEAVLNSIKNVSHEIKYYSHEIYEINIISPIYPRIDIDKELNNELELNDKNVLKVTEGEKQMNLIDIDYFKNLELKVAQIIECEKIQNADKLLKLKVKIGEEIRTIVSGIANFYTSEQLINKKVIVVTNLKPIKLRGITSEGMILCAQNENKVVIISPIDDIDSGSIVR